jgi:hypothetical protein
MLVARRARWERLGVKDEYSFEVSWRRPERSGPPLDLLRVVGERYPIAVFELTSEKRCLTREFGQISDAALRSGGWPFERY